MMGRELCRQCGHELPNDTGTYCPLCGEPRKAREKSSRPAESPADRVERILTSVGELSLQFRFSSERKAGVAFETVDKRCKGLSAWRMRHKSGAPWFVVVLGETRNRAQFEKARALLKRKGGTAMERDVAMIDALRERRRSQLLGSIMRGEAPQETRRRMHFGRAGAELNPDGTMSPSQRPQG